VKKREINIFPLKKILRPGTIFFKAFLKDYFAFFLLNSWKKYGKEEGKAGKEEQRRLFLKEVVKKSKDAEKKRNEINKEVGYKKQVFIFDFYLILKSYFYNF
jgi:phage/plasmid-associated DNA primase